MSTKKFLESVEKAGRQNTPPSNNDGDRLDQKYAAENKKHRNWLSRLNHWHEIATHRFVALALLSAASIGFFALFIVARYRYLTGLGDLFYSQMQQDALTALSYIGTVIVTIIVTKYIDSKKK